MFGMKLVEDVIGTLGGSKVADTSVSGMPFYSIDEMRRGAGKLYPVENTPTNQRNLGTLGGARIEGGFLPSQPLPGVVAGATRARGVARQTDVRRSREQLDARLRRLGVRVR